MTLVFWEVLWRTSDDLDEFTPKEAEEPYAEFFEKPDKRNPTSAEMRDIVVRRKERPTIPAYLGNEGRNLMRLTPTKKYILLERISAREDASVGGNVIKPMR